MGTQKQISDEAKGIYKRLAQKHMNTRRFGRKSSIGKVFRPNPLKQAWSKYYSRKNRDGKRFRHHVPDKLSKADVEKHLSPYQSRIYLENAVVRTNGTEVFVHPVVVDIDCLAEYTDAREVAALVELWLYDNEIRSACLAVPSTNGKGCHLWMMIKRGVDMSAVQFNQLLGQLGNALRGAIPIQEQEKAHLCRSGNPIKGSLSYELPNSNFDPVLAASFGRWRSAKPSDRIEDIVINASNWMPVDNLDDLERYSEKNRIRMDEYQNLETLEGPVQQTSLEEYERSKHYESFIYNEKLERSMVKRGTLISFPCTGRKDLASRWIKWYEEASCNPITPDQLQNLARLAPLAPAKIKSQRTKTPQFVAENIQCSTRRNYQQPLNFNPDNKAMQRLNDHSAQKHEVAYAAAQLALQRTQGNATVDDVLDIYESSGRATGSRDQKRITRAQGALDLAKKTYYLAMQPLTSAMYSGNCMPRPSFDQSDLQDLEEQVKRQWPDACELNRLIKDRRLDYDQIAVVMAFMSKYSLTNCDGQISRDIVIKSAKRLGSNIHKDVFLAIKRLLLNARWLNMTNDAWKPFKKAQCYEIGPNAPSLPWIDRYYESFFVPDQLTPLTASFSDNPITMTTSVDGSAWYAPMETTFSQMLQSIENINIADIDIVVPKDIDINSEANPWTCSNMPWSHRKISENAVMLLK